MTGKIKRAFQIAHSLISPLPVPVSGEFDSNVLEQWSCPDFLKRCCSSTRTKQVPPNKNSASVKKEEKVTPAVAARYGPCNQLPHAPKISDSEFLKRQSGREGELSNKSKSTEIPNSDSTENEDPHFTGGENKKNMTATSASSSTFLPSDKSPLGNNVYDDCGEIVTADQIRDRVSRDAAQTLGTHPDSNAFDEATRDANALVNLDITFLASNNFNPDEVDSPPADDRDVPGGVECAFCNRSYRGEWSRLPCGHVFHKLCFENCIVANTRLWRRIPGPEEITYT